MAVMHKCPFPGCSYIAETITNVHCEREHNKSKKDIINEFGKPERSSVNARLLKKNIGNRFNNWSENVNQRDRLK